MTQRHVPQEWSADHWPDTDLVGEAEGVLLLGRVELDVRLPVRL